MAIKVAAKIHSDALECDGFDKLSEYIDSFVSWTTDMGVELGMTTFKATDWRALCPAWYLEAQLSSDIADGDEGDRAVVVKGFMSDTLIVAGALHIIHNIVGDIHKRLKWWDSFWEHLKALEALLSDQQYRDSMSNQSVWASLGNRAPCSGQCT
jgi:hypothetical protein